MTSHTPVDALTRALAQSLESAESKGTTVAAQRKIFKESLKKLQPLRAAAQRIEIESLYNVGAWYSLFGYPPKLVAACADAGDRALFASSRHITALASLKQAWNQKYTVPRASRPFQTN